MNTQKGIALVVLIIIAIGLSAFIRTQDVMKNTQLPGGYTEPTVQPDTSNEPTVEQPATSESGETFSGKISAFDTACFADGACTVTIDGKKVIIAAGYRMNVPPVGTLQGVESIGDLDKKIGHTATVYAHKNSEKEYTLYGSVDYYVKVQ